MPLESVKRKNSKIGLRHVRTRPKWRLEPKFHEAGTFGGWEKRGQTDTQTDRQDSCFISIDGAIKPDIVVWDRKEHSALIIDVSVPNDFGINRAEREKVTKYQDLKNALKDEWELKEISVIPVIVGATGIMKDNLQSYLDNIPGKPDKYQVQIAALRGTVSLLKRALGTSFK